MSPIVVATLLVASGPVRTVPLTAETIQAPVRVVCPVGQTTRLVFPWPMLEARGKPADVEAIGLVPAASRPQGVLEIQPSSHPARARILIHFDDDQKRTLILNVRSSDSGGDSEIRFAWRDTPAAPARSAAPSPAPAARPPEHRSPNPGTRPPGSPAPKVPPVTAPSAPPREAVPSPVPTPSPSAPPTPEASASPATLELDALGMARATSVKINRREGRPGQRPVVLEDALHGDRNVPGGDRWIWFRFRVLEGASLPGPTAGSKVRSLKWEKGSIDAFHVEASGKDLRVYVQLPRAEVTKKTRVEIGLTDGGTYRFALSSPWLASFLSSLF